MSDPGLGLTAVASCPPEVLGPAALVGLGVLGVLVVAFDRESRRAREEAHTNSLVAAQFMTDNENLRKEVHELRRENAWIRGEMYG